MTDAPAWAIRCHYRPGGAEARMAIRLEHIDYMIAALPNTIFGGALLDDAGVPVGMEVILRLPDRAAAESFLAGEPYARAGLFASVVIERVRTMTPPNDGGPLYEQRDLERARRG